MSSTKKGHELLFSRLSDALRILDRGKGQVVTSFLTLSEQQIAKDFLKKKADLLFWGGYENAERKRLAISYYELDKTDTEVVLLHADFDPSAALRHPDFLGTLLSLGIDRSQIGDILVKESEVNLFCTRQMKDFILDNLIMVKHTPIVLKEVEADYFEAPTREVIQVNCSSLRLDAVVSALAKCSRSKAMEMIRQSYVKVNDIVVEDVKQLCDNDFVSIRRTGRFLFTGTSKTTRKNRLVLEFEKYV